MTDHKDIVERLKAGLSGIGTTRRERSTGGNEYFTELDAADEARLEALLLEAATALSKAREREAELEGERDEQVRQLLALRMSRPSLDDFCLLSRVFNSSGSADIDQTWRINEWLKALVADARGDS